MAAGATLRGKRRAAVLLVALGPDHAAEVLQHMEDEEVEAITQEMALIHHVPPEMTTSVFDDLAEYVTQPEQGSVGGVDFAFQVLEKRFGRSRAEELFDNFNGINQRPFDFLRRTPPEQVAAFLQDEAPAIVSIVIASLKSGVAAKVLAELPRELQAEVSLRIATMTDTNPQVVRDLEAALKHKLSAILDQELTAAGGVQSLAEILNQAGRATERHVLQAMAETDSELAEEVRQRIFTFEDIIVLSDRDIQVLLRDVDQKDLTVALRGVGADIADKLLSNMSERGAAMLREDMEAMPPQRKAVVDEAQGKIVRAARALDDAGTITIRQGGADGEEVI